VVAQRRGTDGVVAGSQLLHPARREGQHHADLKKGPPLRKQPDRLELPRLGRVLRRRVARPNCSTERCSRIRAMAATHWTELPPYGHVVAVVCSKTSLDGAGWMSPTIKVGGWHHSMRRVRRRTELILLREGIRPCEPPHS
jgi:hypothetical protein